MTAQLILDERLVMFERRSLKLPITLGVILIVMLVALTIGWVLLATVGAMSSQESASTYWTILSVGSVFLVLVLAGVVTYLVLSVKEIRLNRRQANFIDSVTHELKSPIASLKLYLQTLNRRHVPIDEQTKFYRYMLDDVERLDQLINHLLDAARTDRSVRTEEVEELELEPILRSCVHELTARHQVPESVVQFEIQPSIICARRVDVDVIFRNLIDNALKYAGTPPEIQIASWAMLDGKVIVQIRDNGPGVPAGVRSKIFGRFVRLGSELEREKPGTGLGLYIVRTFVRRWRGKITVKDRSNGPGAVFEVVLPGRLLRAANASTPSDSTIPSSLVDVVPDHESDETHTGR